MTAPLPPALVPPARIGLIAPASLPTDPDRTAAGVAALRERGFDVIHEPPSTTRRGYLAASDDARLAELERMIARDDIDALVCIRGGFGSMRLLDRIDYERARRHPKLLVGYSDITALQLALYRHAGWRSISGAMVAVDWPDIDEASETLFWDLARGGRPAPLTGPAGESLVGLCGGTAEGVLVGGNLSMVVRLLGTPYLPDLDGAVLFFEEVGEAPYRLDALLAQLRLSGVLGRLGGIVVGALTEAQARPGSPTLSVEEVLRDHLGPLPIPVATGLVYGHIPVKNAMPIGVRARLTVSGSDARLDVLEPCTRPADPALFMPS